MFPYSLYMMKSNQDIRTVMHSLPQLISHTQNQAEWAIYVHTTWPIDFSLFNFWCFECLECRTLPSFLYRGNGPIMMQVVVVVIHCLQIHSTPNSNSMKNNINTQTRALAPTNSAPANLKHKWTGKINEWFKPTIKKHKFSTFE